MSQGRPTKLVRDGETESYDPPPDVPLPDVLVPVTVEASAAAGDSAAGPGQESSYSDQRARRAALHAISGGAIVDEPGGDW